MVSTSVFSIEAQATKIRRISSSWVALFAGELSPVGPVIDAVRQQLGPTPSPRVAEVSAAFVSAYQNYRRTIAEQKLLAIYDISMQEFTRSGREFFGESTFASMKYEIDRISLNVEFMVAGFDPEGKAHIFTVTDPGSASYDDMPGFHAIGAGWVSAMGTLYDVYSRDEGIDTVLYRVCEAKFAAESAPGVGTLSLGVVQYPDGSFDMLVPEEIDPLKHIWFSQARRSVPPGAAEAAKRAIAEAKDQTKATFQKMNSLARGTGNESK